MLLPFVVQRFGHAGILPRRRGVVIKAPEHAEQQDAEHETRRKCSGDDDDKLPSGHSPGRRPCVIYWFGHRRILPRSAARGGLGRGQICLAFSVAGGDIDFRMSDAGEHQKVESSVETFDECLVNHAVLIWDAERENAARSTTRETLVLTAIAALFGLGLYRIDWFHGKDDIFRVASPEMRTLIKGLLCASLLCFGAAFRGLFLDLFEPEWLKTIGRRIRCEFARAYLRLCAGGLRESQIRRRIGRPRGANLIRMARAVVLKHERNEMVAELVEEEEPAKASHLLRLPESFFLEAPRTADLSRKMVFDRVYRAAMNLQTRNARKDQNLRSFQITFFAGLVLIFGAILIFLSVGS